MSELSKSWFNALFIMIDVYCLLTLLFPYLLIRKKPQLKEKYRRFEKLEIVSVIVFLLGGIISMIYDTFTLFSILMILLILVQCGILFNMIFRE